MSLTVDEERNEDKAEFDSSKQDTSIYSNKMYSYGRELCFILALAFTSYAALQKVIPKVSLSPSATPFFEETSLVADFYRGQLGPALSRVVRSDVSFLMFYAPWDAESQLVRKEFEATAKYYHREVYFAAINCWQPESECRHHFPKVHQFPILIVYGPMKAYEGLEYRGPRTMPHMVHFLKSIIQPLTHIGKPSDITRLMTKHDAVVVGFFDLSLPLGNKEFYLYHSASLKHLESHPFGNVRFAVVTNSAAFSTFADKISGDISKDLPKIKLYLWNETVGFPGESFSADSLIEWIDKHCHSVAIWVSPPGVKSNTLSQFVDKGPVLFLFTPRNPFWEENMFFNMLREIALEYYNCDENDRVMDFAKEIVSSMKGLKAKHEDVARRCTSWIKKRFHSLNLYCDQAPQVEIKNCTQRCKLEPNSNKRSIELLEADQKKSFTVPSYDIFNMVCCQRQSEYCPGAGENSIMNEKIASNSWPNAVQDERIHLMLTHSKEEECKRYLHGELMQPAFFPKNEESEISMRKIQGLACKSNQTISMVALDSLQYHHFAMGLGVDVLSRKYATAVAIVHASGEMQHIMIDDCSKESLAELIFKYSSGVLHRSYRSELFPKDLIKSNYSSDEKSSCPLNYVCVLDLTSNTFKDIVLDDSKNVVVLYHSPSCAFCSSIWHVYLTVARIFTRKPNGEEIQNSDIIFTRIDGDANDLSWEFTMDSYPSILFFPAHRKSDSRVFPINLPMTVSNIAQFIAANLNPEARLTILYGGCDENCIRRTKAKCLEMIASLLASSETIEKRLHHLFVKDKRSSKLSAEQLEDFKRVLLLQRRRLTLRIRHLREIYKSLGGKKERDFLNTFRSSADIASMLISLRRYHRGLMFAQANIDHMDTSKLNKKTNVIDFMKSNSKEYITKVGMNSRDVLSRQDL